MKRTLLASLLTLLPLTANAGWGFTSHTSNVYSAKSQQQSPMDGVPTVDYWSPKITLQFDILETLASLTREDRMNFGVNGYYTMHRGMVNQNVHGLLQLGVSFDVAQSKTVDAFDGDEETLSDMWILLQPRLGAEIKKKDTKYGFGMYVVSGLGIARVLNTEREDGDDPMSATELAVGTGLQISAWIK